MDSTRPDVAIVGAGPAGAWAACRLARAGARVTLFDASHPREKPCGGGVTGRALALLEGIVTAGVVRGVPVRMARFQDLGNGNGAGGTARVPLVDRGVDPESSLVVVSRQAFDQALLEAAVAAGAQHVAERVVDVEVGPDGAGIRTRANVYAAPVVLGADGAASLVRRRVAVPFHRAQISLACGFFVREATSSEIVIACLAHPPGYLWCFPRPDHLAVGVCAPADRADASTLRGVAARWLASEGHGDRSTRVPYSWPIPSLSVGDFDNEHPAGTRWMLLGDAAGLVDPLTREGIYFALRSGDLAAESLLDGHDPPARYVTRLHDDVVPELERAAALKDGFFSSGFTPLLVEALARSGAVREIMADLVAGRQPYKGLRRRLLQTWEVALAWRLLRLEIDGRFSAGQSTR